MNGLLWYLVKRVLSVLIVVVLIATAVFAAFFLVSEPVNMFIPRGVSQEVMERITSDLKLNEPIPAQYINFMVKTLTGKFFISTSVMKGANTNGFIFDYVGRTLALFAAVLVPALLLGRVLGRHFSGRKESMLLSRSARLISLGFASISITSGALVLLYIIANASHSIPLMNNWVNPWVASFPIAFGTYILMMKGKERHFGVTRSGSPYPVSDWPIPTTSITKLYVAWVMVIVLSAETVFSYHGLGLLTWEAVSRWDATVLMACIFLITVTIAFTNFALDLVSPFAKSWSSRRNMAPEPAVPIPNGPESTSPAVMNASWGKMLSLVSKDYAHRRLGIAALVIVLVFLVIAAFAPFLATVPNPDDMANYETQSLSQQIINPMPPSLEKSPRTGFIHPLGTDNLGRDVYSELLYGARAPLVVLAVLVVITLAVGIVIWIAATYATRLPSGIARIIGGFSSVMADYVIAVPILVVFMTRWYRLETESASLYILLAAIPLLVWACSFRVIRVKMPAIRRLLSQRQTTGVDLFALRSVLLKAAGSILYISKFVVLFGFLTMLVFPFFISYRTDFLSTSWAWLSEQAYEHANAIHGNWWLVFPQLVLAALLAGGVYTMLDTLEQVMVRRFGTLE